MGSIIDKLIEEALLEFTSLTDEERAEAAKKDASYVGGAIPLNPGAFVDPTNWAKEIAMGEVENTHDPIRNSLPDGVFEAGNLSALEDDLPGGGHSEDVSPLAPRTPAQSIDSSLPPPGSVPSQRLAPIPFPMPPAEPAGGSTGLIVVVLAAAAAVVVAWFAHIIPH
jgi:serine/threonine-protein kinase